MTAIPILAILFIALSLTAAVIAIVIRVWRKTPAEPDAHERMDNEGGKPIDLGKFPDWEE